MAPKCYRCNQPYHCSNECPQRRVANLVIELHEQDDLEETGEQEEKNTKEVYLTEDSGEWVSCIVQKVLLSLLQHSDS